MVHTEPRQEVLLTLIGWFIFVEDLTLHDSQMVSQEISIDDDDGEHVHGTCMFS